MYWLFNLFILHSVAEYLGRYYSEELDIFYTLSLNDEGYLIFQPPRMHPYLFRISEVRNDQTFQDYDLSDQIIVGEGIYNEKIIF